MRIVQTGGDAGPAFAIQLVTPCFHVVLVFLFIKTAEESVFEIESGIAEEQRVGVSRYVVLVIQLVDEDVVDQRVEKRGISSRADSCIHVGGRGCPRKSRIDMND